MKIIKKRVKDQLGTDNGTGKEMQDPDIEITIEKIYKQIAKEKEQQREPANQANPGEEEEGHQEQEVLRQDFGDESLSPLAAAEWQVVDNKCKGVCATCGLRELDEAGVQVIYWVQCNTCRRWFHEPCVGWKKETTSDFCCEDGKQPGEAG